MAAIRGPRLGPVTVIDITTQPQERTLPDWAVIDPAVIDSGSLDRTSQTVGERSLTVARVGEDLPIIYGRDVVGAKIYRAKPTGGAATYLWVVAAWCEGEIESVESIRINGEPMSGVLAWHYTGTASQTGDSNVASVWGQSDDLPNIAYSVFRLTQDSGLDITAVIQGRKVYDPRSTLTAHTTNPVLCLADYIDTQTDFSVNWASVGTAADYCDEIITGTTKRWEIGLTVKRGKISDWINTLKEYANVFLYKVDGEYFFIPNEARATDHTLTGADIQNLKLRKVGQRDSPTQVFVDYTLPTVDEWQSAEAYTTAPAASDPLRVTRLRLPGYFRTIHAQRKATETLNRATLEDLEATFDVFDEGLKYTQGDVLDITHPLGLTTKLMRIHDIDPIQRGRWRITSREYDPATFSGEIVTDPTTPDTILPSPADVPTPVNYAINSVVEVNEVGVSNAHVLATWDALGDDYIFAHSFEVSLVLADNTLIDTRVTTDTSVRVGPLLPSDGTHHVRLKVIGSTGVESTTLTLPIEIDGKLLPPTTVPNFAARGVFSELRTSWGASSDEGSIRRYELRYGAAAVTWANATFLTRIDALTLVSREIATGTYDILIKAIDNTGVYSTNEARVSGVALESNTVTSQADWAADTNMFLLNDGDWVTESSETWNALFPNAMNTYTSALYSYQTTTSDWTSEELDPALGAVLAIWTAGATYTDIAGTAAEELELFYSAAWNAEGAVSITKTAEKSRYLITGSLGDVFLITPPVNLSMDR